MGIHLADSQRARRRLSWVLLLALVPMLTFMGHWPSSLPIPGTNLYVSIPLAGAEAEGTEHADGSAHDHSQHCHGASASCSDAPAAAAASFALLNQPVAIAVTGLLLLVGLRWWRPLSALTIAPDLRPPRIPFASVS